MGKTKEKPYENKNYDVYGGVDYLEPSTNNKAQLREIKEQIDKMRKKLNIMACNLDDTSHQGQILKISMDMDLLINKYYKLFNNNQA